MSAEVRGDDEAEPAREDRPQPVPGPPTPLIRQFVRYLAGFGVGVALGLSPFLGQLDIPPFTPLLDLIPRSVRPSVLPLSAALMGLVAVVVQWYGHEQAAKAWLRRMFARSLAVDGVAFLLLFLIHSLVVVRVPFEGGKGIEMESFLVGFSSCPGWTKVECVERVGLSDAGIAARWGETQIFLASASLQLAYLLFTGTFGALVGLLLLRSRLRR